MKNKINWLQNILFLLFFTNFLNALSPNQTQTLSPVVIYPVLPFKLSIDLAPFSLSVGLQSFSLGVYGNKWLFVGGRLNGLHGFDNAGNNFPPNQQNTSLFVFDLDTQITTEKPLNAPDSGLTQAQIDTLSTTAAQYYQSGNTLYITGGYGFDNTSSTFTTKDVLTAINVPGLIHWVIDAAPSETAAQYIRQISDPVFQVTGGKMGQISNGPTLLIFGQDFEGEYTGSSNGIYTMQVRRFQINDDGTNLSVEVLPPSLEDPAYRRRDLNVVSRVLRKNGKTINSLIALSGVFTLDTGVWTVPVEIAADGSPSMADPELDTTFKQGMNNYDSANIHLYSSSDNLMYEVILGGITYEFYKDGELQTDDEIPFTNQVVTIKIDPNNNYTLYLMGNQYPFIPSQFANPGNELLFGAEAEFIPVNAPLLSAGTFKAPNEVINLDAIKEPMVIGYIVGGIQSSLPNTNSRADSAASPYIFAVTLTPGKVSEIAVAINTKYCAQNLPS